MLFFSNEFLFFVEGSVEVTILLTSCIDDRCLIMTLGSTFFFFDCFDFFCQLGLAVTTSLLFGFDSNFAIPLSVLFPSFLCQN